MAEFSSGVVAPVLVLLGALGWLVMLVGSCALVALVYWLRELRKKR